MRLYDFRCDDCDRVFEELVSPGDEVRCPACASTHATRQLSAFAVGHSDGGARDTSAASSGGGGCAGGGCSTGFCGLD
ncbi:MAG: zinc ribbon domain-containing protein [Polyangiaceae bacterium]|nr:zinc ribbon domain-containing protein [Polyangiaceae bacterium]